VIAQVHGQGALPDSSRLVEKGNDATGQVLSYFSNSLVVQIAKDIELGKA
jgi:hypothetical protein